MCGGRGGLDVEGLLFDLPGGGIYLWGGGKGPPGWLFTVFFFFFLSFVSPVKKSKKETEK